MLNVPVISEQPANTPPVQAPDVAPMRNAAPEQIEQLGAATAQAGSTLQSVGLRIQEQLDDANVKAAETKFIQRATDLLHGDNGYLQKQGADALNAYDGSAEALAKAKQEALESLGNDTQKQIFQRVAQQHLITFGAQMSEHRARERQQYTANESLSRADSMRQMASQVEIGSDKQKTYAQAGVEEVYNFLAAKGVPRESEQGKKAERDYRTVLFEDDVNRLLDAHRYDAAKLYYSEHAAELDTTSPKVQAIKKTIEDTTLAIKVRDTVAQSLAQGGTFEQQAARVDTAFQNNPEALKEARAEFAHAFTVHQESRRLGQEENFGKLWDMRFPSLPGKAAVPMAQIVRSAEWQALDGSQRNQLKAHWETFAKRNENDPSVMAQKFATYWGYASNPQALAQMSDAQIIALTPQMGLEGVRDLLGRKQDLQKPGRVIEVAVDTDQFKAIAFQAGIPAYATGKELTASFGPYAQTAEGYKQGTVASTLGYLRDKVEREVQVLQQSKGRKALREEVDQIIKQNVVRYQLETTRSALNPARWFGDATTAGDTVYAYQLNPWDKLYIPDADRQQLLREARAVGVTNPTEQQLQNAYFLKRQPAMVAPTTQPVPVTPKGPAKVGRK